MSAEARAVTTPGAAAGAPAPGRVVWVTGASSGIGRAVAHACARRGDRLVLSARAAEVLEQVREECLGLGATAVLVAALDISDAAAVDAAAREAVGTFGGLDLVVQNAGVAAYARVEDADPATFDRVVEVNLLGAYRVAAAALRVFRDQRSGKLVVVGSVLGRVAVPYMGAYIASKWALRGLVRVLRTENADLRGVSITLVAPGGVDTPIYDTAANTIGVRPRPPFPVARPEKVAATVLRAAESNRRELGVGWANPGLVAASALLPTVWDRVAMPAMRIGGLSRIRTSAAEPARSGNLLAPRPELEQLRRDPRAAPDGTASPRSSAPLVNRLRRRG